MNNNITQSAELRARLKALTAILDERERDMTSAECIEMSTIYASLDHSDLAQLWRYHAEITSTKEALSPFYGRPATLDRAHLEAWNAARLGGPARRVELETQLRNLWQQHDNLVDEMRNADAALAA